MKFVTFFNNLLKKICMDMGIGQIAIDHAIEKIRCNGSARRVTWIDAYDELKVAQNQMAESMAFHAKRLSEITRHITAIEEAMIEKGVARCTVCAGKDWRGLRSLKGTGLYANDWVDCPTCQGTGIISVKKLKNHK